MIKLTWDDLKQQAIVEALDFYIHNMKKCNANQSAIDFYTQIVKEIDPQSKYTVTD